MERRKNEKLKERIFDYKKHKEALTMLLYVLAIINTYLIRRFKK